MENKRVGAAVGMDSRHDDLSSFRAGSGRLSSLSLSLSTRCVCLIEDIRHDIAGRARTRAFHGKQTAHCLLSQWIFPFYKVNTPHHRRLTLAIT